jgi:hypothetical protein
MALTLFSNTHLHSIRVHRRTQAYVNVLSSNEALKVKVMEIKKNELICFQNDYDILDRLQIKQAELTQSVSD